MSIPTESASNVFNDPVDEFLSGIAGGKETEDEPAKPDASAPEESAQAAEVINTDPADQQAQGGETTEEAPKEEIVAQEFDIESLDVEKQLAIFNKVTGLGVSSIDDAKKYSEVFNTYPELQKKLELYPTLVEKLKQQQDVMSYFPDETAYKVAQLAKQEQYKGKEGALNKLLYSDVSKLGAMDIVKMHAELNTTEGIKNPFRYTIKKMGLDPDEVINNFDDLSEDDQDLFNGFAAQARKELSQIGSNIEIPKSASEDIEALLSSQITAAKDDLAKKKEQIVPFTKELVDGVKELKVMDDWAFKLDLSAEDKNSYAEFLNEAILSGDFNIATDEGKRELYGALMDEIWLSNKQKVVKALDAHLRTKIEKEFREKYDNATPLNRQTPAPTGGKKQTIVTDIVEQMVNELL